MEIEINKKETFNMVMMWIAIIALLYLMPNKNVVAKVVFLISYIILTIFNKKERKNLLLVIIFLPFFLLLMYLPAYISSELNDKFGIVKETWFSYLGTIIGSTIGVFGAYFVMKIELRNYEKQKESERNNGIEVAKLIVETFLFDEIKVNYQNLIKPSNILVEKLKNGLNDDYKWNIRLAFKEFDKVKYEIIKYNNEPIKNVLEIYRTFKIIHEFKRYGDLSNSQKEQISKGLKLCEEFLGLNDKQRITN